MKDKEQQPDQSKPQQQRGGSKKQDEQGAGSPAPSSRSPAGIGSSQGQDRGSSDMNDSQSTQGDRASMTQDSTGAFKER